MEINNKYLEGGKIPRHFNKALSVPVQKKGDEEDCNNYGRIVILDVVCKVLERIIKNQLNRYQQRSRIIPRRILSKKIDHRPSLYNKPSPTKYI